MTNNNNNKYVVTQEIPATKCDSDFFNHIKLRTRSSNTHDFPTSSAVSNPKIPKKEIMVIDTKNITFPETSTMTNNNNKKYAVTQEKPATKCDSDFFNYIKLRARPANTHDFPTSSAVSNPKIPKKEIMVIDTKNITFPETSTITNNNNKKYAVTQEKPATKCDSDFFNHIKLRARPANTHDFPTSSAVSNPKIPKQETMVIDTKNITFPETSTMTNNNNKKYVVTQEKPAKKSDSDFFNHIKLRARPANTHDFLTSSAVSNPKIPKQEIMVIDTKNITFPETSTMTNNNNKKYVVTQEKPAKKSDSDFFNHIKLRARPANTHDFPTSSAVSNPKIPKQETMVIDTKNITFPETSTMTNNNNKKYVVTQENPATKCDSDFFNHIKLRARPSKTRDFPTSSAVSNPKIPKKETMVLENDTITIKNSLKMSRKESNLETVTSHNIPRTMETEKTSKIKKLSKDNTVKETFEFLKPSVSSKHCPIMAHKKNKEEVIKTDTTKYILPAKCNLYPNFTFDYDEDQQQFVVKEISPEAYKTSLWNYINIPLNPERVKIKPSSTDSSVVSKDLKIFEEFVQPIRPLQLGINCDNFDTLTTMFHKIVPEVEQQNTYICSFCNTSSNGLPGNKCQKCRKAFHWKCVAHTASPNLSISWFCNECITSQTLCNPASKPYFQLFNDTLHHNPN